MDGRTDGRTTDACEEAPTTAHRFLHVPETLLTAPGKQMVTVTAKQQCSDVERNGRDQMSHSTPSPLVCPRLSQFPPKLEK
jgi:hypothetical protein